LNLSKSPEDRLATMEMFDALDLALGNVVRAGSQYADQYSEKGAGGSVSPVGKGKKEPAQPPWPDESSS
jgi:ATP phosphoribosyltransferase regulatory subunit HisZ